MKIYDPKRIADNLRQIDDVGRGPSSAAEESTPPASEKPDREPLPCAGDPATPEAEQFTEPDSLANCFQHLHDELLPNAGGSMSINELPQGTRFAFLKKTLIRVMRVISAKQADFNLHTWRALNVLTEAAEEQHRRLNELQAARLEQHEHIEKLFEATGEMRSRVENATRALESWVGQVIAEVQAGIDVARTTAAGARHKVDEVSARTDEAVESARRESAEATARNLEDLSGKVRQLFGQFQRELRRVEQRIASTGAAPDRALETRKAAAPPDTGSAAGEFADDVAYQLYEDRWRGDPDAIRQAQMEYVELLRPYLEDLPPEGRLVLDVGFGRGEFLRAVVDSGLKAKGIEINRAFVEEAQGAGLDAVEGDAIEWLAAQPAASFGAIVAFQVLEHVPPPVLRRFLDLVSTRLAPGGVALFETLNPGSFSAYRWYFMDLSHERFLVPDTVRFVCECAGLEHVETRLIHPMADWERLSETGDDVMQDNIRRLNDALFGCQDYCMLVRRPAETREGEPPA